MFKKLIIIAFCLNGMTQLPLQSSMATVKEAREQHQLTTQQKIAFHTAELEKAAILGNTELIEEHVAYLKSLGSNADASMRSGITPLMRAAQHGKFHVLETLVNLGANITAQDDYGANVLDWAIQNHTKLNFMPRTILTLLRLKAPVSSFFWTRLNQLKTEFLMLYNMVMEAIRTYNQEVEQAHQKEEDTLSIINEDTAEDTAESLENQK